MSGIPPVPQQPHVPHYQRYGETPAEPKTSALAIAAFVCGLIFCIPMATPAAAIVLGVIALIVIGTSNGKVKGNGFAVSGILFGLLSAGLQIWFFTSMFGLFQGTFVHPAKQVIASIEINDLNAARKALGPTASSALTDEELSEFGQALQSNCGKIIDVKLDLQSRFFIQTGQSQANVQTQFNPNQAAPVPMPIVFNFDGGKYFGYAEMVPNPNPTSTADVFKIGDMSILVNGNIISLLPVPVETEDELDSPNQDEVDNSNTESND